MTILFDSRPSVKPANRTFGLGFQVPKGPRRVGYTASDARWWAEASAALEGARIDAPARDHADELRYEAGIQAC